MQLLHRVSPDRAAAAAASAAVAHLGWSLPPSVALLVQSSPAMRVCRRQRYHFGLFSSLRRATVAAGAADATNVGV